MATPILLLHCSGSTGAQWRSLAASLGPRYRAIAPDLAGGISLAREAAALAPVLERLGGPAHLVGHSYGGAVALHLARTRPWLFRSLTLIEPSAFHLLRGGDAIDFAGLTEIIGVAWHVKADLACGDLAGGYGRFIDYWGGAGAWAALPAEKRAALAPQLARVDHEFDALLNEPAGIDEFADLALPTLLVQGGCTELPSRCIVHRLRKVLPNARFAVVQGAGHMLPLTHRDAVNPLIAEFLESTSTVLQQEAA